MNVRQQVADLINAAAVPGVTGSVYPPQIRQAGVAWAQWASTDYEQSVQGAVIDAVDAWQVLVLLPDNDQQQTADALDAWQPAIVDALAPSFALGRSGPVTVAVAGEGAAIPALSIAITL